MSDITVTGGWAETLSRVDRPLFAVTGGFIVLFCTIALFDLDTLSAIVDWGFNASATYFGLYWQLLLLATFFIGLALCALPGSKIALGGLDTPEFSNFKRGAMIICTLLAGGGVFLPAGEPIAHYLWTPPLFGELGDDTAARANAALAQSYLHWGLLGHSRLSHDRDAPAAVAGVAGAFALALGRGADHTATRTLRLNGLGRIDR